ncbi:MAG: hypothetical protein OEY09_19415 [Gammaproteobacteria bacterium]|nr:hypothetical protein [Gammaproteobacteria bacterium]
MFIWIFGILLTAIGVYLTVQYNILIKEAHNKSPAAKQSIITAPKPTSQRAVKSQWRAIKVERGLTCCRQVELIEGKLFLLAEAPTLPLAQCDSKECSCKYMHLDDRRAGDDRRESNEYDDVLYRQSNPERRSGKGRRAADRSAKT